MSTSSKKENSDAGSDVARLLNEQNILLRQMDWKLWVITNALCDAMIKQGLLENDPRQ